MKEEIKIFFTALMFYTRIPCPKNIDHSEEYINKATRYFPLIGWVVGAISFLAFCLGNYLFGSSIGILFSLIAGVLTTGAFHEDGLADFFDGFGGGWTKEKILDIMKDSRVGAYGAISLVFLFGIKFLALNKLLIKADDLVILFLVFISYHSLARLTAINIAFILPYSKLDQESKAKPISKKHSYVEIIGAYLFGVLPLIILASLNLMFLLSLLPLMILVYYMKNYFNKWINGYTGDCLGAVEQMAECICLLSFLFVWKFT
ncbi:MAG: adenosylcobinamide-GDP ribazoletransferase [Solirubrobacteraceae bacterium]